MFELFDAVVIAVEMTFIVVIFVIFFINRSSEYDCQVSTTPPIAVTVFLNVKGEYFHLQMV